MGEKLEGEDLALVLKDGTVLCRMMNCIKPNSVKKYKETVHLYDPSWKPITIFTSSISYQGKSVEWRGPSN